MRFFAKVALMVVLAVNIACGTFVFAAESQMASRWKTMNAREREAYALGARDGICISCQVLSNSQKEYVECINDIYGLNSGPDELFSLYDRAYKKGEFSEIPSELLLSIWADRKNKDMNDALKRAKEAVQKTIRNNPDYKP